MIFAGGTNYIDLINFNAQQLRTEGANAVIVMSELGMHKDIALEDKINQQNVDVFSQHTHGLTNAPLESFSRR